MIKRIINAKPHLSSLLKEGDTFIIGFGVKSLTTDGIHYRDLGELIKGNISELIVMGKKGPLRENTAGKFVRKQPENKEHILKHIKYTRRDGTRVEYDRVFHVWEKELLHKFGLKLYKGLSPQDEVILHLGEMKYYDQPEDLLRAKAAMNIAIVLGGYFQIYNQKLEPIINITGTFDRKVLSRGEGSVENKLDDIKERFFGDGEAVDNSGDSYRFSILKNYEITDIYDGEGGFNEYFHFEFANDDIVILENLRSGNATYIFNLSKYDKSKPLNKTTARKHASFKDRVIHHNIEHWKSILSKHLKEKDD